MNTEEFRDSAFKTIEYIIKYRETIGSRRVCPGEDIKVNYLRHLISGVFMCTI